MIVFVTVLVALALFAGRGIGYLLLDVSHDIRRGQAFYGACRKRGRVPVATRAASVCLAPEDVLQDE